MAGAKQTSISATQAGKTSVATFDHLRLARSRKRSSDISKSSSAVGCGECVIDSTIDVMVSEGEGFGKTIVHTYGCEGWRGHQESFEPQFVTRKIL